MTFALAPTHPIPSLNLSSSGRRRIHNVLKGIPDDRDGLFDTIQRSKNHYQKRAYQCIKCMVALFSNCSVAYQILQVSPDVRSVITPAATPTAATPSSPCFFFCGLAACVSTE